MSWRDTLRMPVGEAAKQGAAKLTRVLQSDVSTIFRRTDAAGSTATAHPSSSGHPGPDALLAHGVSPSGTAFDHDTHDSHPGVWTAQSGAAALAVQHQPQPRPRAPLSVQDYNVGDTIADAYDVTRVLARNQRFSLYLAHHTQWDIDVVIKAPQAQVIKTRQDVQTLAGLAGRWSTCGFHPHVAYCYHVHFVEDVPLLVLEYLDGGSLRTWMTSGRTNNLRVALNLAIQMCHGIEHAHSRGVWHGGLTPENVLLTADGMVRVTDFGISYRNEGGTEAYVAPERWVDTDTIDSQTDIFALGVCFYELFCGGRPYEVTRGPRRKPAEPRPSSDRVLPERLSDLLKACVDWEQLRRPASVADIRRELTEIHAEQFRKPSPFAQLPAPRWDADGWNNQGMAALMLGRVDEAEAAWENALASDPAHLEASYNLGVVRWRRGECSDDALIQQLRRVRPGGHASTVPTYLLALVYLESGNSAAALPLLEDLLRRTPDDPTLRNALTLAKRLQGGGRSMTRELTGHLQFVSAVCISNDGHWLLSASDDCTIGMWDPATGRIVRSLEGHAKRVSSLAITPEATLALSGSDDFTLKLWDLKRARCQKTIQLQGKVFGVGISADGERAISSSSGTDNFLGIDGTVIHVWDVAKERVLRQLEGHVSAAKSVAMTPDGKRAVSGGDDQTVRVWDLASGSCIQVFQGHDHYVSCVAISADGNRVISGAWDRTVRVWDVQRGRCLAVLAGHTGILTSVCLSADGRSAVSGGWDGTVRIWDLESGRCLRTLEGHTSMVTGVALSGDASIAVSGSWDTNVRVWDVPKPGPAVCTPRLSERIAYAQMPSAEPDAEELLAEAERAVEEHRFADALAHLARARQLASPTHADKLAALQRELSRHCAPTRLRAARPVAKMMAPDVVAAAQWTGDGRRLFTAGRDARLRLWDVGTHRCVRTLDGHSDRIHSLRLAHDGALAVSASGDGTVRVWDLATGSAQRTLKGHRSVVTAVAFGDEDRWTISASYDHTLRLWELSTGTCIRTFKGHTRQVTAVCTSSDGRWAASGGYDKSVRVWEVATGQCVHVLEGHGAAITALQMHPDGSAIVSASADGTLRLWDLDAGTCRAVMEGHAAEIVALELSPDGRWAITASTDGSVRMWELSTGSCTQVVHNGDVAVSAIALSNEACALLIADADRCLHLLELEWELEARSR